jgi:hypothetical protein
MNSLKNKLGRLALLVGLAFTLIACGTPTVEYQLTRFQRAMDSLDILAAKQPQMRMDIDRKKMEFQAEFEKVRGLQGEEGSKIIGALCYRVEQYEQQLNPQPVQPAGTTQPGSKLGATPGQPMGVQPAAGQPGVAPAGGKLGATPGAAPGGVAPTDSGFGGGGAAPAPVPGAQPQGGSGFGGAAPASGTQPAPAPGVQPQGGSGFGGQ